MEVASHISLWSLRSGARRLAAAGSFSTGRMAHRIAEETLLVGGGVQSCCRLSPQPAQLHALYLGYVALESEGWDNTLKEEIAGKLATRVPQPSPSPEPIRESSEARFLHRLGWGGLEGVVSP